ncbi:MAG: preprotein translocase subunit YajC [Propionibacterium sp.]|jgi:preprotein translocase, yajC subunit|nr:preprotein translocase subunit YajC [Propionibacterium sp.]
MEMLLMLVIFVGAAYFLMIRPQQKRMREHQSQIDALQPGERVILTSGIFATLSHIADTQAIVELAPGVEVTILKQAIARVAKNDEEEFEFTDEVEETIEGEENVDGSDASEPEDAAASEEPVSEKH